MCYMYVTVCNVQEKDIQMLYFGTNRLLDL